MKTGLLLCFQNILMTFMADTAEREWEPQCYSRFDYEYKVVQKIVALENMCEDIKNRIKNTNNELNTEIGGIKGTLEDYLAMRTDTNQVPIVAFLAVLDKQRLTVAAKTTIIFDMTVTNIGNGYSSNDGVFTAACDGVYSFSVTILADNSGEVWSDILLNGDIVARTYARASDNRHDQGANTVILQLKKGDRVYVVNEVRQNTVYGERYTSFSGSLLGVQP